VHGTPLIYSCPLSQPSRLPKMGSFRQFANLYQINTTLRLELDDGRFFRAVMKNYASPSSPEHIIASHIQQWRSATNSPLFTPFEVRDNSGKLASSFKHQRRNDRSPPWPEVSQLAICKTLTVTPQSLGSGFFALFACAALS
jgi:hypothetical protein